MKKEYNIQCKKCGEIIKIAHITPDDNLKFDVDGDKANLIVDEYGNIPIHNDTDEILNEVMQEMEEDMYMVAEISTIEPKPIDYLECIFCKKLTPIYRIMSIPVCSTCRERREFGSVYGLKRD